MTLTISLTGTRHQCARGLKKIAKDKDYGLISNLKLTRVSFLVWHLQFDASIKEK